MMALPSTRSLDLRDKLAQLMFVRIGSNIPPVRTVEDDAPRIESLLAECPVGGLALFNGHCSCTPDTLQRLQSIAKYPLLIGSDIERGVGQQLRGFPEFPHAMAFGALGAEAAGKVNQFARLTGQLARQSGIHIAFAPTADVQVDPRNPIIATRAFGTNPQQVAELVAAYVQGSRQSGLLATAKHFPGHGNTPEDSHHALPTVQASVAEMEACELIPFRAAIAAGVPIVMSAHVRYPCYDPSGLPATRSAPILTQLLRQKLGFEGTVVSDSLQMEGVKSPSKSEGTLAVEALLAGVDVLLDVESPQETAAELVAAVEAGRLPTWRVDQAYQRLDSLRQNVLTSPAALPFRSGSLPDDVNELVIQSEQLAREVARGAVHVVSRSQALLPYRTDKPLVAMMLRPSVSHLDPVEPPLATALRDVFAHCTFFDLGPDANGRAMGTAVEHAQRVEQVLVAIVVKPTAWHRFGLLPDQERFLQYLLQLKPCVLASLGTPVALASFEHPAMTVCTLSDVPVSQEALALFVADPSSFANPVEVVR